MPHKAVHEYLHGGNRGDCDDDVILMLHEYLHGENRGESRDESRDGCDDVSHELHGYLCGESARIGEGTQCASSNLHCGARAPDDLLHLSSQHDACTYTLAL